MRYGVGLDIGTMNIVSARHPEGKTPKILRIRDSFISLPASSRKMLNLSKTPYVVRGDELLVLGDEALEIANMFGQESRRPLKDGLVSATEVEALPVLKLLIQNVLGSPETEGEHCYFSVPAPPIDQDGKSVIYHQGVFTKIVSECGYTPHPSNEAMAIIFAETAKESFSGIAISFGSGMSNVAIAYNTIEGLTFSIARGGDWIDSNSAMAVASTHSRMTAVKESGFDLLNPRNREEEALAYHYRSLIEYVLDNIANQFRALKGKFHLPKPIPLVVSGGTSKAGSFMEYFTQIFEKERSRFPIEVSEIRHAKDPLNAVALGMMIQSMQEYSDDE